MSKLLVEVQEVNDTIPKIASLFKIGYKQDLSEYTVLIPADLGKGKITGMHFPNGLDLYTFNCSFHKETEIVFKCLVGSPVRLVHCVEGEILNYNEEISEPKKIGRHEHFFIAPKKGDSHTIQFPKETMVSICCLEIDREKFKKNLSYKLTDIEPVFYSLLGDVNALQGKYHTGKFSLKVSSVINEVFECNETGLPRVNFMWGKALEILSFMLSRYRKEMGGKGFIKITGREYKAVGKVVEYINTNLSNLETIPEMALRVGVNVNKLQAIFQAIFGQTVNEYIRNVRLSKALSLLHKGDIQIGEIVQEVGLNSRSYFSKIFKDKYGVLPREILHHEAGFIPNQINKEKIRA